MLQSRLQRKENVPLSRVEFVFGGAATLLILSAMIVALPAWHWWKIASQQYLSLLFVFAASLEILIPNEIASRGLYVALVLLAIACATTTRRTTAGRWVVALPSNALLGLILFSALAPAISNFDIRIADTLADINQLIHPIRFRNSRLCAPGTCLG